MRVPSVVLLAALLFDGSSRAVASTVPAANLAKDYLSVWFLLLLAGTFALAVMVPLAARIRRRKGLPPLPRLYWLPAAIGCPAFVLVTVLLSPTRYSFTPIVVVAFGLAAIGLGRCLKHRRVERDVGQRATPTQRMARRRRVLLFVSIAAVV